MVRTRAQRAALRRHNARVILDLPEVLLRRIASFLASPAVVVAGGADALCRTALRRGVDDAERARFGGVGVTVLEAARRLAAAGVGAAALASRGAAGRELVAFLGDKGDVLAADDETPEDPTIVARVRDLVAFGADVDACDRSQHMRPTALHWAAGYGWEATADLLTRAGADLDARVGTGDAAGRTPLSWALSCESWDEASYEGDRYGRCLRIAARLLDRGASVALARADYAGDFRENVRCRVDFLADERRARAAAGRGVADLDAERAGLAALLRRLPDGDVNGFPG